MKMSDKSGKLGKLKMPKREEINLDELDMGDKEESPEEEAAESPEEEKMEDESAEKHTDELKSVSDEDLLAEVKKRGLMSQLEKETGDESSQDAYV